MKFLPPSAMIILAFLLALSDSTTTAVAAPDQVDGKAAETDSHALYFARLKQLCGATLQGYSTFPDDPEHPLYGKLLVAHFKTCSEHEIRIPFSVGDDHSRTWIITRMDNNLSLKHDHRHADGGENEITDYGGTASDAGSAYSQSFPADDFTAKLIPEAATNRWTINLSEDGRTLTYYLERDNQPRFKAVMELDDTTL